MIYGKISEIQKYRNSSNWFSHVADFLSTTDLNTLPLGKTQLCGDHVFYTVMEADTKPEDVVDFEIHKRYWDVQIDIEGTELIQIGMNAEGVKDPFREDIDFGTVQCSDYISCVMGPGKFIVCMEEEPHKPTLTYGNCSHVKKCVIKVEV